MGHQKIALMIFAMVIAVICLLETSVLISSAWYFFIKKRSKARKVFLAPFSIAIHLISAVGIICLLYGFLIEPYFLEINHIYIKSPKIKSEIVIVHISDLHCDRKIVNEMKIIPIINSINPDIVAFTGDALNHPDAIDRLFEDVLPQIKASIGKYAVLGNNDYTFYPCFKRFKETGFIHLFNKSDLIETEGGKLNFAGFDYFPQKIDDVLGKLNPDTFNILLYHSPDMCEELYNYPVDLYLTGHTHGGQVAMPFYGALITLSCHGKKYESGLYRISQESQLPETAKTVNISNNEMLMYVNRGLGMEGGRAPRVRFCARPEITVIHLSPAE